MFFKSAVVSVRNCRLFIRTVMASPYTAPKKVAPSLHYLCAFLYLKILVCFLIPQSLVFGIAVYFLVL